MAYVLLAVYSAAPVVRRRTPAVAVGVGLVAGFLYAAAEYPVALTPVVLLSVYSAAALLPPRSARTVLAIAVIMGVFGATLSPGPTDAGVPALIVSAWPLGNFVGSRRAHTEELERKNRQLEQARLELADRAVAEERLRIARELHDVVAHSMSVVALHAGTGRMVAESDPAAAREALATIERSTRSALHEMRRLLGVLRGSGPGAADELGPAPGLRDVDALVADVVRSGVTVQVQIESERLDVPAGVDLSAFRIVQEALTNVIKHGGRAPTKVEVRYAPDAVTVEVTDGGAGRRDGAALSGTDLPASPSRDQFAWAPNGAVRPDGSRQYLAPHADLKDDGYIGGCEHCIHDDGTPVEGFNGRPRVRCCQVQSRLLPREVLALDQGPRSGSRAWYCRWNPRNRVEGSYGVLKNLAVVNYCRSFHQFVGLARETIVTVFAMVTYNFHMLNQWTAQQAFKRKPSEDDNFDPFGPMPDAQPVAAAPHVGKAPEPFKAPKGLDFLGLPLAPPG